MKVVFQDLQQSDNPLNGSHLGTAAEVVSLFRSFVDRKPFLFELRGENGFTLTIGLANDCASAQYGLSQGLPPYFMAMAEDGEEDEFVEFLAGNTPTPIPRRFCLPIEQVVEIANTFVSSGAKSDVASWEEI